MIHDTHMKNALVDYKTENDHQRMQCANEIFSVGHRDFMSFEQRNTIKIFIFIMDDKLQQAILCV